MSKKISGFFLVIISICFSSTVEPARLDKIFLPEFSTLAPEVRVEGIQDIF